MIRFFAIIYFTFSINSFAQMALPSVFPETKTVNPAALTMRKAGNFRATALVDSIKKTQHIKDLDGVEFVLDENTKIDLVNANIFKAGKGGGVTTEIAGEYVSGKKTTSFVDSSNTTTTFTTDSSSNYLNLSIGTPSKLGLGLVYVNYASKFSFSQKVNGTDYKQTMDMKTSIIGARPGIVIGSPNFSVGLLAEYDKISNSGAASGAPESQKIFGAAVGIRIANILFEVGIEADPTSKATDPVTNVKMPMPMKLSFISEFKIWSITFGYKGMMFKGSYMDLDKIIQSQMVYGNLGDETRLEHVFNFSLGGDTGFGLGGSASFSSSTTKEKSNIFFSKNKHETKSTEVAASIKLSYNY